MTSDANLSLEPSRDAKDVTDDFSCRLLFSRELVFDRMDLTLEWVDVAGCAIGKGSFERSRSFRDSFGLCMVALFITFGRNAVIFFGASGKSSASMLVLDGCFLGMVADNADSDLNPVL